jgi:hypothetical protein
VLDRHGGGTDRIPVLRRREGAWTLFHYVEAPLAALIQLRHAAEAMVDRALHERIATKAE